MKASIDEGRFREQYQSGTCAGFYFLLLFLLGNTVGSNEFTHNFLVIEICVVSFVSALFCF